MRRKNTNPSPARPDQPGQSAGASSLGGRVAARVPALLHDRTFRRYWSGETISMFGDQISSIALPLVGLLALHATAAA